MRVRPRLDSHASTTLLVASRSLTARCPASSMRSFVLSSRRAADCSTAERRVAVHQFEKVRGPERERERDRRRTRETGRLGEEEVDNDEVDGDDADVGPVVVGAEVLEADGVDSRRREGKGVSAGPRTEPA